MRTFCPLVIMICACKDTIRANFGDEQVFTWCLPATILKEEVQIRHYRQVLNLTLALQIKFSSLKTMGLNCIQTTKSNDQSSDFRKLLFLALLNEQNVTRTQNKTATNGSSTLFVPFPSIHRPNTYTKEETRVHHPVSLSASSSDCQASLKSRSYFLFQ